MIEFKPGNIAHVSNGTRVCGMSNPDAPTEGRAGIHRFLLRYGDACIIVKVHPSRNAYAKKHTGGATYDVTTSGTACCTTLSIWNSGSSAPKRAGKQISASALIWTG